MSYLEYLTRTYPDLTTADLKLCTFLRMNLNTKEIAEIMGLSVRSVESRRYRLRKLYLSKEDDLVSNLISLIINTYLLLKSHFLMFFNYSNTLTTHLSL